MSWRAGESRARSLYYNGRARKYHEKSADFPDPKLLELLICMANTHGGSFMFLLDYGGLRYLYRVTYNEKVSECVENKFLRSMHDALEKKFEDESLSTDIIHNEAIKFLRLFWPFLKADYEAQLAKGVETLSLKDFEKKPVRNIQLRTVDGKVQAYEHTVKLIHQESSPIKNVHLDLKLFSRNEIVKSKRFCDFVFKVRIKEADYVLKELPLGFMHELGALAFKRELELLQKMPRHPNLIRLAGLRDAGEGNIDGILLPYVHGRSLEDVDVATTTQKEKWKKQVSDAVRVLHEKDLVWGDAKAGNILVEEKSDNAILIDFEGGTTNGWVDEKLANTREGDLQGLARIVKYIENL